MKHFALAMILALLAGCQVDQSQPGGNCNGGNCNGGTCKPNVNVNVDRPARPAPRPGPVVIVDVDKHGHHPPPHRPPHCRAIDVPKVFREANYNGGSCMHAAMVTVLRSQGLYTVADWWRKSYSGPGNVEQTARIADDAGLRFAYTTEGSEAFLDWCSRTRRAAAIHWVARQPGDHAVTFAGYNKAGQALVIDNNHPGRVDALSREEFLRTWRASGGRAITVVYDPPAPRPWI